jgi:hypothetical protein
MHSWRFSVTGFGSIIPNYQLQPDVPPHVSHFMQVPFRTSEKCPHSPHISPS